MKKLLLSLLFPVFCAASAAQQPSRTLLYTLEDGQTIMNDRSLFSLMTGQVRYSCTLKNSTAPKNEACALVVNGKVLRTAYGIQGVDIDLFDPARSTYAYATSRLPVPQTPKDVEVHLVSRGDPIGTYADGDLYNAWMADHRLFVDFAMMGQEFLRLPDGRVVGPVGDRVNDVRISPEGKNVIFLSQKDNRPAVFWNGKYVAGATEIATALCNAKGDWLYGVRDSDGYKACLNGKVVVEDSHGANLRLTSDGDYGIRYGEGEHAYLQVNDQKYRVYDMKGYCLGGKGHAVYRYEKDGKDIVCVDGKTVGTHQSLDKYIGWHQGFPYIIGLEDPDTHPEVWDSDAASPSGGVSAPGPGVYGWEGVYDAYLTRPCINSRGIYAYAYNQDGRFYVSANGKAEGPYDRVSRPVVDPDGHCLYTCNTGGKTYLVRDGVKTSFQDVCEPLEDGGHVFFSYVKDNRIYLDFDGAVTGPFRDGELDALTFGRGHYGYVCKQNDSGYFFIDGIKTPLRSPMPGALPEIMRDPSSGALSTVYRAELKGDPDGNYGRETIFFDAGGHVLEFTPHNKAAQSSFTSHDGRHLMVTHPDYRYVMVDNQKYGNGELLAAVYNPALNAFRWCMLEGRELVAYEYKLQ